MKAISKRVLFPTLLVLGGVVFVVYGVGFHATPVLVEQEIGQEQPPLPQLPPPFPFAEPPWLVPETPETPPELAPPFLPVPEPPRPPEPAEKQIVTLHQAEPHLIREVTVGGVIRLPSGEIKRTYSGKPPAQCPT